MRFILFRLCPKISNFFDPLLRHPIIVLIITISIASSIYILRATHELVRQNCWDAHILALELMMESGPDFIRASNQHRDMLEQYVDHMENRPFSRILAVLYPKYSPRKRLQAANRALKEVKGDQEEAKKLIWRAGEEINQFCIDTEEFSQGPVTWFQSEDLPDSLVMSIDHALSIAEENATRLENEPTLISADKACVANRRAVCLLFLSRFGPDSKDKIEHHLRVVKRVHRCTMSMAQKMEHNGSLLLHAYSESEARRIHILTAMLNGDIHKVRELLRTALDEAVEYTLSGSSSNHPN